MAELVGIGKPGTYNPTLIEGHKYMRNKNTGVIYPFHEELAKKDYVDVFVYYKKGDQLVEKPKKPKRSFANSTQNQNVQRPAQAAMGGLSVPE